MEALLTIIIGVPFALITAAVVFWIPVTAADWYLEKKCKMSKQDERLGWSISAGFASFFTVLMIAGSQR